MDKYTKGVLFIAIVTPFVATVAGIIFPEPSELTPISSFIIAMVSVFYMGMLVGIRESKMNGDNKK